MKTVSGLAIAAAASIFATSAMAADLGGNCCADLEERVSELEATTVRKGNRKVTLQISGHVNHAVMFWDDGAERNAYVVNNEYSSTRFRFLGDAKINSDWSAGYLLEWETFNGARSAQVNQGANFQGVQSGDDPNALNATLSLRHSAWYLDSKTYGRLWVGHTSTATDGITYINCGDWVDSCTAIVEHMNGRMELVHGWQIAALTTAANDAESGAPAPVPSLVASLFRRI
jgi:hypothetical protein